MVQRIRWIDTLKGFLALLVVLDHSMTWSGLTFHMQTFRFIRFFIVTFHMAAFFAVSGYIQGRITDRTFNYQKVFRRVYDLAVPTVAAMAITFCIVIALGNFSLKSACSTALFWFMWTIMAINIAHPVMLTLIKKEKTLLVILMCLTFLFGVFLNVIGKFLGYYLLYEWGYFWGRHLTEGTERNFFQVKWGVVLLTLSAIVICLGYLYGGDALALKALFKIPIGVLMFYSLCSIFLRLPSIDLFALAGKYTLLIYFFQFTATAWIVTYTPSLTLWKNVIIFAVIVWFNYCVPVFLADKYKDTQAYKILFHASAFLH